MNITYSDAALADRTQLWRTGRSFGRTGRSFGRTGCSVTIKAPYVDSQLVLEPGILESTDNSCDTAFKYKCQIYWVTFCVDHPGTSKKFP